MLTKKNKTDPQICQVLAQAGEAASGHKIQERGRAGYVLM